jgi:hypothetical protein
MPTVMQGLFTLGGPQGTRDMDTVFVNQCHLPESMWPNLGSPPCFLHFPNFKPENSSLRGAVLCFLGYFYHWPVST